MHFNLKTILEAGGNFYHTSETEADSITLGVDCRHSASLLRVTMLGTGLNPNLTPDRASRNQISLLRFAYMQTVTEKFAYIYICKLAKYLPGDVVYLVQLIRK